MTVEVALVMAQQQGAWLVQLKDDIAGIIDPGCWVPFGGHLDPGETPEQALRRELLEEINWQVGPLRFWFTDRNRKRIAHFFLADLDVPLSALELLEGQDLVLASMAELSEARLWSPKLQQYRPVAACLECALERLKRKS